ncbi:DUF1093 domain-containing protein [Lentilactobacillus kribbianus]|uniref:DUF1093 domain-containing protein n=1 Tax=Lentilactobacillus kribbianus TaxID=2729622 RepID=UPI0015559055|nr:DUF1093 domain-containing protein [Lentilactobacillus kribbianus]
MKKIISLIALLILAVGGYFGWQYYTQTYQGHPAYAVIPNQVPKREATVDDNGKKVADSYSYSYKLHFVRTDGKTETLPYEVMGSDPKPFTPNATVKAEISDKRVVKGPNYVSKDKVPDAVKDKLNQK